MLAAIRFPLNATSRIIASTIRRTLYTSKIVESQFFTELTSVEDQQPTIKCRNRKFLAGSTSLNLPETVPKYLHENFKGISINQQNIEDLSEVGRKLHPIIEDYINQSYTAILIKDLPIKEANDFNAFVKGFLYEPMSYEAGNGYRENVVEKVYTSSEEPPEFTIEPHNEMTYLATFPRRVNIWLLLKSSLLLFRAFFLFDSISYKPS